MAANTLKRIDPDDVFALTGRIRCGIKPQESGCWEWQGGRGAKGHGRVKVSGKLQSPHRIAYILAYGPIPEGEWDVMHRCDNPSCVRPSHLAIGTRSDNMIDAAIKGRVPSPRRVLSPLSEEYDRIWNDFANRAMSMAEAARSTEQKRK